MSTTVRMGIAFLGAVILGRLKKFKLAIAWFGLMTGQKLKLSPAELLSQGSKLVESSPQVSKLVAALRGPLLEAAQKAVTSAASSKLEGITDQLVSQVENVGRATASDAAPEGSEETEDSDRNAREDNDADEGADRDADAEAAPKQPESREESTGETTRRSSRRSVSSRPSGSRSGTTARRRQGPPGKATS